MFLTYENGKRSSAECRACCFVMHSQGTAFERASLLELLGNGLAHYQLLKQIEQRHVLRLEFQGGLHQLNSGFGPPLPRKQACVAKQRVQTARTQRDGLSESEVSFGKHPLLFDRTSGVAATPRVYPGNGRAQFG